MERITQQDLVLDYLKRHKNGITSWDAIKLFGCTRLSSVIYLLKKRGYNIEREMCHGQTKFGGDTGFARYYLVDDKKEKMSLFERLRFFV